MQACTCALPLSCLARTHACIVTDHPFDRPLRATPRHAARHARPATVVPANSPQRPAAPSGGTATVRSLYDTPDLYDQAFGYRDFEKEAKFLAAAYKQHCKGDKLNSVLELG